MKGFFARATKSTLAVKQTQGLQPVPRMDMVTEPPLWNPTQPVVRNSALVEDNPSTAQILPEPKMQLSNLKYPLPPVASLDTKDTKSTTLVTRQPNSESSEPQTPKLSEPFRPIKADVAAKVPPFTQELQTPELKEAFKSTKIKTPAPFTQELQTPELGGAFKSTKVKTPTPFTQELQTPELVESVKPIKVNTKTEIGPPLEKELRTFEPIKGNTQIKMHHPPTSELTQKVAASPTTNTLLSSSQEETKQPVISTIAQVQQAAHKQIYFAERQEPLLRPLPPVEIATTFPTKSKNALTSAAERMQDTMMGSSTPTVQVHIGRLEIRSTKPSRAPAINRSRQRDISRAKPVLSLCDYLKQ